MVARTARISKRDPDVIWLERHMRMTQVFIGLGDSPFAMVLGLPTHNSSIPDIPNIDNIKCFLFQPGTGIMINTGTWHDFPLAVTNPVTCLTMNSAEVVEALVKSDGGEMNDGDVYKIKIQDKLNTVLTINL